MNKFFLSMGPGALFGGIYCPVYCGMRKIALEYEYNKSWFNTLTKKGERILKEDIDGKHIVYGMVCGAFYFVSVPVWCGIRHGLQDVKSKT